MSLPIPPSGILDSDTPWYPLKVKDSVWAHLKARLVGGVNYDGSTTLKYIDCTPEEADKIISNLKKDPRGYPTMASIKDYGSDFYNINKGYLQFLKDGYLYDEPKPEPEEIPVQVEVVEVEQKQVDDPIVIKIEAPFESTPESPLSAPKRISVPRRSGIIPAKSKVDKRSAAERMSDAFESNLLGPLINSIQNPPAPEPPKQRKQKEVLVKRAKKIKSTFKENKGPKLFENTSLFLFNKAKNAFGRAAEARRIADERGLPKKERGFYATRALRSEFGGDFYDKTRGTFSKSPAQFRDPALTKQQRYLSRVLKPNQTNTDQQVEKLSEKINQLEKSFQEVIDIKKSGTESESDAALLGKTLEELKDKLSQGNKLQKDINTSKQKLLTLESKAADQAQAAAEKAAMDKGEDLSDFEDMFKPSDKRRGRKTNTQRTIDWIKSVKWKKWLKRLKNPGKTFKALKRLAKQKLRKIPGAKQVSKFVSKVKPLQRIKNVFQGGQKASQAAKGASAASKGGGLLSKATGLLDKIPIPGKGVAKALAKSPVGKFAGRLLPGANIAIGAAVTASKIAEGDYLGAVLSAGSMIPGPIGWGFLAGEAAAEGAKWIASKNRENKQEKRKEFEESLGMVSPEEKERFQSNVNRGVYSHSEDNPVTITQTKKPWWKFSEGGVVKLADGGVNAMIGEAGPEMLIRAGETGGTNPLQAFAPIIVATREITKRAGTWADPVENMVRQITDPIAKTLKLPVTPLSVDIDKTPKAPKKDDSEGGIFKDLFSKIKEFITGEDGKGGGDGGGGGATTPTPVGSDAGGYKSLLDMIAGVESTSSGGYEAFNRGGSAGGHVAHGSGDSSKVPIAGSVKPLSQRTVAEVMRLQAAGHLHATGRYQIIQSTLSGLMSGAYGETGVKPTDLYNAVTQDKLGIALIKGRLRTGANVENFRNEWIGLHNVDDAKLQAAINGANAVYQANPNATATASAPSGPSGTQPVSNLSIVGDSVAQGFVLSGANKGGRNNAIQGRNPQQVEAALKSTVKKGNADHVVLSTGLSNNTSMMSDVKDQMAYLQSQGISFTVLPLASGVSNSANLNRQLQTLAPQYGGRYASQIEGFTMANDGYNAHMANPAAEFRKLRLGGS